MAIRAAFVLVTTLIVATGCGGSDNQATVACAGAGISSCTASYPAKARNNQASTGGPPIEVLGVQTQLFSISGGEATLRIDNTEVHIGLGKTQKVGALSVRAEELTDTLVVLTYSKS